MCCQSGLFVLPGLHTVYCCLMPITLLWEQWNICVPWWVSAERAKMMEGERKWGMREDGMETLPSPRAPLCPGSSRHARLLQLGQASGSTQRHSSRSLPFMPCKTVVMCSPSPQEVFPISHVICRLQTKEQLLTDDGVQVKDATVTTGGSLTYWSAYKLDYCEFDLISNLYYCL